MKHQRQGVIVRTEEFFGESFQHASGFLELTKNDRDFISIKNQNELNKELTDKSWKRGNGAVYIIKDSVDEKFLYVGSSTTSDKFTPLATIKRGLNRKYRYKFRGIHDSVHFHFFTYGRMPEEKDKCIKTIESEIVYAIRKITNAWPEFQNEIHFHQKYMGENRIKKAIEFTLAEINLA